MVRQTAGPELLRFAAAFAVLVWHYQHFAFDRVTLKVLRPFYEYGWYFLVLRFSRLYRLYLVR